MINKINNVLKLKNINYTEAFLTDYIYIISQDLDFYN